ncbi:MAG: hypothetical protein WGN25_16930 [Candidatus Electrothrix sp. GW3-4]|uniref:hypothetical protein n=1 Tax=Candidatus Electrothrix sp. GW3-4 TaxID=3126740 RepID=UPI0030D0FCDD
MPMNSSIFNFKRIPSAFILALLFIVCCEYGVAKKFGGLFSSHEVDQLVQQLKTTRYDVGYVLIGDSVGLQLSSQYYPDSRFAVLATNQAIEMTGQYFLIQRFLERNPPPKAVIFTGLPFIDRDLNQAVTENFVLRVFTEWREIYEVFLAKYDLTMMAKTITYKVLFSYKHKLQMQKKILGYTNADMYSGLDQESAAFTYNKYSLLKVYRKMKQRGTNSSVFHLGKLLALLQEKGIDFYYIPAPAQQKNNYAQGEYKKMFSDFFPELERKYSNFLWGKEYKKYPANLFRDFVHFNEEGLVLANKVMKEQVYSIMRRYALQKTHGASPAVPPLSSAPHKDKAR